MKTGRFLSTMAITALLVACSNEDFLNEQAPVVVDGNRPTAKVAWHLTKQIPVWSMTRGRWLAMVFR